MICVAENNIFVWNSSSKQRLTEFFDHKAYVIYIADLENIPQLIESIDASFVYIKWNWETKEVFVTMNLFTQTASYLTREIGLFAATIGNIAFIATTAGYVRAFKLKDDSSIRAIALNDSSFWCKGS